MGRFWKIGPQQTLYMPGCWLRKGKNEIIGLKQPILDKLRAEVSTIHRKKGETLSLEGEKPVWIGKFEPVDGWQEVKFAKEMKGRYFCLEGLSGRDGKNQAAIAELDLLGKSGKTVSRQQWTVAYADSERTSQGNNTAEKIFDLQESTYWGTANGSKYPHQVVIDLGEEQPISGFRYLPRADKDSPGMIKEYKVYMKQNKFVFNNK